MLSGNELSQVFLVSVQWYQQKNSLGCVLHRRMEIADPDIIFHTIMNYIFVTGTGRNLFNIKTLYYDCSAVIRLSEEKNTPNCGIRISDLY